MTRPETTSERPSMSQFSPDEAHQIKTTLCNIDDMLGRVTATADHDFIAIGNTLGHSVEVFGRLSGNLTGLAEELQSQDAANAVAALEQAAAGIGRMSGGSERIDSLLAKLEEEAVGVAKYLDLLGKSSARSEAWPSTAKSRPPRSLPLAWISRSSPRKSAGWEIWRPPRPNRPADA